MVVLEEALSNCLSLKTKQERQTDQEEEKEDDEIIVETTGPGAECREQLRHQRSHVDLHQRLYHALSLAIQKRIKVPVSWGGIDKLSELSGDVLLGLRQKFVYKILQIAANLSQWKLAEAANYMAPSYHHLRNSGKLEELDEELVDMVRAASVRLSQEGGGHHPSP
ncbi:BTB/POZ domain-containing protein [Camellia lanceoleosa]|uniref:BTB/POZ domain-containing protein n=1 Tax=Camellia lanceoleosa TaxID=1840588 RepID=A0ACC0H2Q3_9ERIC|nr:BTB/POZ domain-containing protein [Camellia lanceoleosa]